MELCEGARLHSKPNSTANGKLLNKCKTMHDGGMNFCSSGTLRGPKPTVSHQGGTWQQRRRHEGDLCSTHSCSPKANKMFGCIWKGTANNPGNIIMPLYKSVVQAQMGRKVMMQKRQKCSINISAPHLERSRMICLYHMRRMKYFPVH